MNLSLIKKRHLLSLIFLINVFLLSCKIPEDSFENPLDLEANAEKVVFNRSNKPLRAGLVQGKKLSLLDELNLPDSTCDSGAGCFI